MAPEPRRGLGLDPDRALPGALVALGLDPEAHHGAVQPLDAEGGLDAHVGIRALEGVGAVDEPVAVVVHAVRAVLDAEDRRHVGAERDDHGLVTLRGAVPGHRASVDADPVDVDHGEAALRVGAVDEPVPVVVEAVPAVLRRPDDAGGGGDRAGGRAGQHAAAEAALAAGVAAEVCRVALLGALRDTVAADGLAAGDRGEGAQAGRHVAAVGRAEVRVVAGDGREDARAGRRVAAVGRAEVRVVAGDGREDARAGRHVAGVGRAEVEVVADDRGEGARSRRHVARVRRAGVRVVALGVRRAPHAAGDRVEGAQTGRRVAAVGRAEVRVVAGDGREDARAGRRVAAVGRAEVRVVAGDGREDARAGRHVAAVGRAEVRVVAGDGREDARAGRHVAAVGRAEVEVVADDRGEGARSRRHVARVRRAGVRVVALGVGRAADAVRHRGELTRPRQRADVVRARVAVVARPAHAAAAVVAALAPRAVRHAGAGRVGRAVVVGAVHRAVEVVVDLVVTQSLVVPGDRLPGHQGRLTTGGALTHSRLVTPGGHEASEHNQGRRERGGLQLRVHSNPPSAGAHPRAHPAETAEHASTTGTRQAAKRGSKSSEQSDFRWLYPAPAGPFHRLRRENPRSIAGEPVKRLVTSVVSLTTTKKPEKGCTEASFLTRRLSTTCQK